MLQYSLCCFFFITILAGVAAAQTAPVYPGSLQRAQTTPYDIAVADVSGDNKVDVVLANH